MTEFDDEVLNGLRTLDERAPIDANVWARTEHLLERRKRRRQAMGAAAFVLVAAGAVVAGVHSAASGSDHVHVATTTPQPTAPASTVATSPTTTGTTTPATSATTATITPTTVPATSTPVTITAPVTVDACPGDCVGRASADVDGDGRTDQIGLFATPPLSKDIMATAPSKLVVRVVFANGRVAEYDDTAAWDASLIGATDVNGDGSADILYFNNTGANLHSGHILRWDGSQLVAVQGADGKPFEIFVSGYAMGGDGFRCVNNSYVAMTIGGNGDTWDASETTYGFNGNELVKVSGPQPMHVTPKPAGSTESFYIPPEYDQILGVHCPGIPEG